MRSSDVQRTFLSVREFADLLGVDRRTVRRAIKRGTLMAIRLGPRGDFRVPASELRRLFADGRRQ